MISLICSFLFVGCSEDEGAAPEDILLEFTGDFECDDIDADRAAILYNPFAQSGWFGWIPSNNSPDTYIMKQINSLNFREDFIEVAGVDGFTVESFQVAFNTRLASDNSSISGTGAITRENNANDESCGLEMTKSGAGFDEYSGSFECDSFDGDTAVLIYDSEFQGGWFGWVPSDAAPGHYLMTKINSLQFEFVFLTIETINNDEIALFNTLSFDLEASANGVTGTGTLTTMDNSTETCVVSFSRN